MPRSKQKTVTRQRRYQIALVAKGLCQQCGKAPLVTKALCGPCRVKASISVLQWRDRQLLLGRCASCARPKLPNHTLCATHRELLNARNRLRLHRQKELRV